MHCFPKGVLSRVAERKRHLELATAASTKLVSADDEGAAIELRSNSGVSLLKRGKSSSSLGEATGISSAASVPSLSGGSECSPNKSKTAGMAAAYIQKLPLDALLGGNALGRSLGPAEEQRRSGAATPSQPSPPRVTC